MSYDDRTGVFQAGDDEGSASRAEFRKFRLSLHTNSVATVTAVNAATERVDVRVDILEVIKQNFQTDVDAEKVQDPVILKNLPVHIPGAASGGLLLDVAVGDQGCLTIMDRSIDQWMRLARAVDPVSATTHALGDSVFVPGLRGGTRTAGTTGEASRITPGFAGIHHDSSIKMGLGAGPTDFVALARLVHNYLTTIITNSAVVAQDGGATFKANLLIELGSNPFTDMGTTKLVAE